jgi:hypothetical protein
MDCLEALLNKEASQASHWRNIAVFVSLSSPDNNKVSGCVLCSPADAACLVV